MMTPVNVVRKLTNAERCDRCNAAAAIALRFKSGELLFCSHHYNENHPTLLTSGAIIVGKREEF